MKTETSVYAEFHSRTLILREEKRSCTNAVSTLIGFNENVSFLVINFFLFLDLCLLKKFSNLNLLCHFELGT